MPDDSSGAVRVAALAATGLLSLNGWVAKQVHENSVVIAAMSEKMLGVSEQRKHADRDGELINGRLERIEKELAALARQLSELQLSIDKPVR